MYCVTRVAPGCLVSSEPNPTIDLHSMEVQVLLRLSARGADLSAYVQGI